MERDARDALPSPTTPVSCSHFLQNATVDASPLFAVVGAEAKGCVTGYIGVACKDCVRPGFYRLGDSCLVCPTTPYAVITFFVVGLGR